MYKYEFNLIYFLKYPKICQKKKTIIESLVQAYI